MILLFLHLYTLSSVEFIKKIIDYILMVIEKKALKSSLLLILENVLIKIR